MNVQFDENDEPILCLHLTQRSADIALGVPYNIAGYALILELFSHLTGIRAGVFGHTLVDAHVYTCKPDGSDSKYDHVPGLLEQLKRVPRKLPQIKISDSIKSLDDIEDVLDASTKQILDIFQISNYSPYEAIKFRVAV